MQEYKSRLFKITDRANNRLHFATSTSKISNGLILQLESHIKQFPNTRLIVIDTLQKFVIKEMTTVIQMIMEMYQF